MTDRLNAIKNALESGKTVYIGTCTRVTKITPKTADKWEKSGHQLFKDSGESTYMAVGRGFACIDYCSITFAA